MSMIFDSATVKVYTVAKNGAIKRSPWQWTLHTWDNVATALVLETPQQNKDDTSFGFVAVHNVTNWDRPITVDDMRRNGVPHETELLIKLSNGDMWAARWMNLPYEEDAETALVTGMALQHLEWEDILAKYAAS